MRLPMTTPRHDAGSRGLYHRWPWIHLAIGVLIVAATALTWPWAREHPRWLWFLLLPVPILTLHQWEEFVLPGGFVPWFNQRFYQSRNPDFPLSRKLAAANHMPLLILLPVLAWLGSYWPFVGLGTLYGLMADGMFHLAAAAAAGRYVPGLVTGVLLYLPLGFAATHRFVSAGEVSLAGFLVAAFGGVLVLNTFLFLPTHLLARREAARGRMPLGDLGTG
jgi:Protein of unknown function with HXXEE motif